MADGEAQIIERIEAATERLAETWPQRVTKPAEIEAAISEFNDAAMALNRYWESEGWGKFR